MNAMPKVAVITGASVSGCGELAVDSAGGFFRGARGGGRHCGAGGGGASCFGAVEKFGRVDMLVNNARIYIGKRKLVLTRSASTTITGLPFIYGLAAAR